MRRHLRSVAEVWEMWKPAARLGVYPFEYTAYDDHDRVLSGLDSLDHGPWAAAYCAAAEPYEARARAAERAGDVVTAERLFLHASGLYRLARWPHPNSPAKRAAHIRHKAAYLAAAAYFDPPLERVRIPFQGRPGEGDAIVADVRRPKGVARPPVVIGWGGLDYYKEDGFHTFAALLDRGVAIVLVDIPGTGDAPLLASSDAERMWDPILDWIAADPHLDETRIGGWGLSTGGYWAAKLAHTHAARFRAMVNHGGCVHHTFLPEWIDRAQHGHYPFELAESLASMIGLDGLDAWAAQGRARLSLLDQGVLDRPCAPLLLVNGLADTVFSMQDMWLLLERGSPKQARFFPGDHMGITRHTFPTIVAWLARQLG